MAGLRRIRGMDLVRRGGRSGFRVGTPDYVGIFRNAAATNGLWLRGDLASRISSTGGLVDTWTSDEGNARVFNGTTTTRPALRTVNGYSVPDFDGTDDKLTGPTFGTIFGSLGPLEVEVVFLGDAFPAASGFSAAGLFATGTSNRFAVTVGTASYGCVFDGGNKVATATPAPNTATLYRIRVTFDNATAITAKLGSGGTATGASGPHAAGNYGFAALLGVTAAAANYFNGVICEIFAVSSLQTDAFRTLRDQWVTRTWGAQV